MYSFFIGSDVSKAKIDVSFKCDGNVTYLGEFSNDHKGFNRMFGSLKRLTQVQLNDWLLCFENTGAYSKSLLEWSFSQGVPCIEECPIKIKNSMGLKRGKDDKADAQAICQYAYEKRDSICPSKPITPLITKLKGLISRREYLVKTKTSLTNSLKEIHLTQGPEIVEEFKTQNQAILDLVTAQIQDIQVKITATISTNMEMKRNSLLAQSIVGIGPITTAKLLALTNNFQNFENARKFACYAGIAPFPNRSGKTIGRNKVSHMANKQIKGLLSNGVQSAIVHDQDLRQYYLRKIAEGKPKGVVLNAVKNKLVQRVFCVIKRQTPYVKIMNYAS